MGMVKGTPFDRRTCFVRTPRLEAPWLRTIHELDAFRVVTRINGVFDPFKPFRFSAPVEALRSPLADLQVAIAFGLLIGWA